MEPEKVKWTKASDNYYRFVGELEKADSKLKATYTKGIIFFGASKAGKTTLLYHLLNKELTTTDYFGQSVFTPKNVEMDAKVTHEPVSCTILPNIFDYPGSDFCLVDLPGFEDTKPDARLANSYYIRKTMLCFKQISFLYVMESTYAFLKNPNIDEMTKSLNTFVAMFEDKAFNEIANNVTLCISKCDNTDSIKALKEAVTKMMQVTSLSDKSKLLLKNISDNNKVLFFRKPEFRDSTASGQKMVDDCCTKAKFWEVNSQCINYHVLMNEDQSTGNMAQDAEDLVARANTYKQSCAEEMKALLQQFRDATIEVINKAAVSEKEKNYLFVRKWEELNQLLNCEYQWVNPAQRSDKQTKRVYSLHDSTVKQIKYEAFCEYKFILECEKAVKEVTEKKEDPSHVAPTEEILFKIHKQARLNAEGLRIWSLFNYLFIRKHTQYRFLIFLTSNDREKAQKVENMIFQSINVKTLRKSLQELPLKPDVTEETYYTTALGLLNKVDLTQPDESIKKEDIEANIYQIRYLKSLCYASVGELTKDVRRATENLGQALLEKRAIRKKNNEEKLVMEEAAICSKMGHVLYKAELYTEALKFFRTCNNFTMTYRCVLAKPSSFSVLIETGRFFASLLQFEKAKELFQKAFDDSDALDKKTMAWNEVLKLTKEQKGYIDKFDQTLQSKRLVGELEKPEEALKSVRDALNAQAITNDIPVAETDAWLNQQLDRVESKLRSRLI